MLRRLAAPQHLEHSERDSHRTAFGASVGRVGALPQSDILLSGNRIVGRERRRVK
jgi:hypothetical protein